MATDWTLKLRNVPPGLRQRVKIAAAMCGRTMEDWIVDALRMALATHESTGPLLGPEVGERTKSWGNAERRGRMP